MHKRVLGLIVGAGFLCTQAANANEMVRYEPSLYLAQSESVTEKVKKTTETVVDKTKKTADKVTKSTTSDKKVSDKKVVTNKKHHHARKHHHAKHPQKHCHKHCHKKKHHVNHKRHMTKSGMERYIDKIAPEHN